MAACWRQDEKNFTVPQPCLFGRHGPCPAFGSDANLHGCRTHHSDADAGFSRSGHHTVHFRHEDGSAVAIHEHTSNDNTLAHDTWGILGAVRQGNNTYTAPLVSVVQTTNCKDANPSPQCIITALTVQIPFEVGPILSPGLPITGDLSVNDNGTGSAHFPITLLYGQDSWVLSPAPITTTDPIVSPAPLFVGLTPGQVGLYQINVRIPDTVPSVPACIQILSCLGNLLSCVIQSNLTIDIGGVSSFDGAAICVQPGQ